MLFTNYYQYLVLQSSFQTGCESTENSDFHNSARRENDKSDVGDFVSDGTFGWLRAPLLMQSCFGPMIEYNFARLLSSAREFVSAISIPQNFSKFSAFHHQFNSFLS
jgi:hypothetical protein